MPNFVYLATATALPAYDGRRLWAFCFHIVTVKGPGSGTLSEKQLPWGSDFPDWSQPGSFSIVPLGASGLPDFTKIRKTQCLPLPSIDGQIRDHLSTAWRDENLGSKLVTLPEKRDDGESVLVEAPDNPGTGDSYSRNGSGWFASLCRQHAPVPQALGLSLFVEIPVEIDPTTPIVIYPNFSLTQVTCAASYNDSNPGPRTWDVSWQGVNVEFRIQHIPEIPAALREPVLSTAAVSHLQPDTSRCWAEEIPIHLGYTLNLATWFAQAVEKDIVKLATENDRQTARQIATALLHDRAHSGTDIPVPSLSHFGPGFPLEDMKKVLSSVPAGDGTRITPLPTPLRFDPATWQTAVDALISRRLSREETPANASEARRRQDTLEYLQTIAGFSDDDDILLDLWMLHWVPQTNGSKAPHYYEPWRSGLKEVIERSGRRLAEHFGDLTAHQVWGQAANAFNGKLPATGPAPAATGPLAPAKAAVETALDSWVDWRINHGANLVPFPPGSNPDAWIRTPLAADTSWRSSMVEKITGDNGTPRADGTKEYSPALDAHPLMVMPPALDMEQYRGMAVFCRVVSSGNPTDKQPWRCLTMGKMSMCLPATAYTPLRLTPAQPAWTAFAPNESYAIKQAYLNYRVKRLGVTEIENRGMDPVTDPDVKQEHKGFVYLDLDQPDELSTWGPLTALRHSSKLEYEFTFAPIHHSGAMPPALVTGGSPWELKKLTPLQAHTDALSEAALKNSVIRRPYRRRVPTGALRIIPTTSSGLKLGQLPKPPSGISLLSDDLFKGNLRANSLPGARPQILFLHESQPGFTFDLEAPAVDLETWRTWMMGEERTLKENLKIQIARLHLAVNKSNPGKEDSLVLSDPAVCGFHISLCRVYPNPEAVVGKYIDFNWTDFGPLPPDEPISNLFKYQKRALKEKVRISYVPGQMAPKDRIKIEDKTLKIQVTRGEVWALRFAPCISSSDTSRFDTYPLDETIHVPGQPPKSPVDSSSQESAQPVVMATTPLALPGTRSVVLRINKAALNWRVEAADTSENLIKSLPDAEVIWKAFSLKRAASDWDAKADPSPPDQVLEHPGGRLQSLLTLQYDSDILKQWAWVSSVRVIVQKWRWNGLPQGACGDWQGAGPDNAYGRYGMAELLNQVDGANVAEDGAYPIGDVNYDVCEAAETPGFVGRPVRDAKGYPETINCARLYLAALEAQPRPAGAPVSGPIAKGDPIVIQLHTESGSAETAPAYYRVLLEVHHRYQELDSLQGIRNELTRTSLAKSEVLESTPWRRMLLTGIAPVDLTAPQVKMVLPLLDAEASSRNTPLSARPGFIALTRDTLVSPFHRLVATLEIAEQRRYLDGKLSSVRFLPEIGPDPVTSKDGANVKFDPRLPAGNPINEEEFVEEIRSDIRITIEGQPFGLTNEREAESPFFTNAGFSFDLGRIKADPKRPADGSQETEQEYQKRLSLVETQLKALKTQIAAMNQHDFMAKVRFHWEIDRTSLWARKDKKEAEQKRIQARKRPEFLEGPSTGTWWVRSLAAFSPEVAFRNGTLPPAEIIFDYQESTNLKTAGVKFRFASDGSEVGVNHLRAPKYDGAADGELSSALLFICWAEVSDGTGVGAARVVTDVLLMDARFEPGDDAPFAPVPLMHVSPSTPVVAGQFLLVHFHVKGTQASPENSLSGKLRKWKKSQETPIQEGTSTRPLSGMDVLAGFLFPGVREAEGDQNNPQETPDAEGIIGRSSKTIFRRII